MQIPRPFSIISQTVLRHYRIYLVTHWTVTLTLLALLLAPRAPMIAPSAPLLPGCTHLTVPGSARVVPPVASMILTNTEARRAGPYTVDCVMSDGKQTYIAVHTTSVPYLVQPQNITFDLTDNRGVSYGGWSVSCWVTYPISAPSASLEQGCLAQTSGLWIGSRSVQLTLYYPSRHAGALGRAGVAIVPIGRR